MNLGHYIMYRRATTGLEKNNDRFSNCSLQRMGPVVISVTNRLVGKVNCLTRRRAERDLELMNVR